MRKGEIKKKEIIRTAESLFCRYGYHETSIQDILDTIHTSKGSFYHHFVSKESLLAAICALRAEESAAGTEKSVSQESQVLVRLNQIFTGMIPLAGEKLSFLIMLLPVFSAEEGVYLRHTYCDHLLKSFSGLAAAEIQRGNDEGVLFCKDPSFHAEVTLRLVNWMWCRICDLIIENEQKGILADPGELLPLIDSTRSAVEKLLNAPYGSLQLLNLADLRKLSEQIHLHWKAESSGIS